MTGWRIETTLRGASDLEESTVREWLVSDGAGGYAMGTVGGLRTRRYHGLLVALDPATGRRHLGVASLDAILRLGDRQYRLGTQEWSDGTINPSGCTLLTGFAVIDGVPRWRWTIGDFVLEREIAMCHGRSAVGLVHRLVRGPHPVRLQIEALVTWRDIHAERYASDIEFVQTSDGFVFESRVHVRGPGFEPHGHWRHGIHYRAEHARGLHDQEDLFAAGTFAAELSPGESVGIEAWVNHPAEPPAPSQRLVDLARSRSRSLSTHAGVAGPVDAMLVHAADQFVVEGPNVVAGYPWFGAWSRDSLTSYEGLFLSTHREELGALLLERLGETVSEGMLANTADTGTAEYNSVDAGLWFIDAVGRHVRATGDLDLAHRLVRQLKQIADHYASGTRFKIRLDHVDGLITQGVSGEALTWMDARIDMRPVTPRIGKPVEINALWISGLAVLVDLLRRLSLECDAYSRLHDLAQRSFERRFVTATGLVDVVDGPIGDDRSLRPNQLLAASLQRGPLANTEGAALVVAACGPLVTPMGMRTLTPDDPAYQGLHRGGPIERDLAYHQGTAWPWLLGPYFDARTVAGLPTDGLLDGIVAHLPDAGVGSISETADGDAPHTPTGCPFQAWSVAEILRIRRKSVALQQHGTTLS